MIFDLDYETRTFRPTVDWMKRRYDEANEKLFNGALGKCDFAVFTTGRGSRKGGINGWFKLKGSNIFRSRANYKLFQANPKTPFTPTTYLNKDNFVDLGKPTIELNGNKIGSEWAFMVTLVHEMCHYFVEMNGIAPARPHGREFIKIANIVTKRSGGQIEVTTHTTLERSQHFSMSRL